MTDCTEKEIDFMELLQAPFKAEDVEWRVQRTMKTSNGPKAIVMPYVTNRAIMNRLDSVFGMGNWKNEFSLVASIGVKCRIYAKVNGEWIFKEDGAELKSNDNNEKIDPIKSAYSNSQKRCAVQYGIGRYLYTLDGVWVDLKDKGDHYQKFDGKSLYWDTPKLPTTALPKGSDNSNSNQSKQSNQQSRNSQQPITNDLKQKAEQFETCLRLNQAHKLRIYQRVNPNTTIDKATQIYQADYEALKRYVDVIVAPAHIKNLVDKAGVDQDIILKWLSENYGQEFNSFLSLITYVDQKAVDAVQVKLTQLSAA